MKKKVRLTLILTLIVVVIGCIFCFFYNQNKEGYSEGPKLMRYAKYISDINYDVNIGLYDDHINIYECDDKGCLTLLYDLKNKKRYKIKDPVYGEFLERIGQTNSFLFAKDNKYGIFNADKNKIIPVDYENIVLGQNKSEYLIVKKDNKVGYINYKGTVIIPVEYDCEVSLDCVGCSCLYNSRKEYSYNGNTYFILKKNGEFNLINEKNEILLTSNNEIIYNDETNYLEIKDKEKNNYYSRDGEFIKSIIINSDWNLNGKNSIATLENNTHEYYQSKKEETTLYIINEKLEEIKLEHVYFEYEYPIGGILGPPEEVMKYDIGPTQKYYLTNDYYITKENDKYIQYSLENKEKLNEFSYVKNIASDYRIDEAHYNNVIVACKEKNECGVFLNDGKILYDFKYKMSILDNLTDYDGIIELKLGKEQIFIFVVDGIKRFLCDNMQINHRKIRFKDINSKIYKRDNNLYNENCQKINEKEINDYIIAGNYIIAEILKENDDYKDYYVYNIKGEKINYIIPNNVKIKNYIGIYDNKIYFLTNKGIYYLTN